MRIFSFIPALAILVTAVAGVSLPRQDDNCGSEIGCELAQSVTKRDISGEHAARTVPGPTNAELARRGLPLKDPIMKRDAPDHRPKPSERPRPNPKKCSYRGIIAVKRKRDDAVLGYISKSPFTTGNYRYHDRSNAVTVTFETDDTGPIPQIDLTLVNSDIKSPPFLGLVQGLPDVTSSGPRSFQYTYLTNTGKTPPGFPVSGIVDPGRLITYESAVWTYDPATERLSPLWVNIDGSTPQSDFFVQNTAIFTSGDVATFNAAFPAPITLVVFEFVPSG